MLYTVNHGHMRHCIDRSFVVEHIHNIGSYDVVFLPASCHQLGEITIHLTEIHTVADLRKIGLRTFGGGQSGHLTNVLESRSIGFCAYTIE